MEVRNLGPLEAEPEEMGPARNHHFRRGVYLLPSFFTVANLLCGYFAILATLVGTVADYDKAAQAIGFAILFDALDGFIARATKTNTEFGKEFDSLADVVSFGIAPAFLAYAWGVRGMLTSDSPRALHVYQLGWLVSFIFVACCAWRLARFNIHGMTTGVSGGRYFVGLPTPAAAGMIAAMVHAVGTPIEDWRLTLLWLALVLGLGVLMASSLRYYGFKGMQWRRRQRSLAVVAMAGLAGACVFYSTITLLLMAGVYVLHGLTLQLVRAARHRLASRAA